jgi:hypothetical protein
VTEFSDNSNSKYTTLLAQEIILPGNWEVGLAEVMFPLPKKDVIKNASEIVYLYCDLCEYSLVGDSLVPCLRPVVLSPGGRPTVTRYENIHYIPVQGNRFATIEILVADDLGNQVEFKDGLTFVTIHLRPRK